MRLLYPLGLLGLLAIPLLIIIYIIKNKYTEQVVSSTYIWTLSEKFLKRRNPISKIAGIVSLILQILAVIFISFAISQPVFTLHGAALDYCFVVDGSGSMNITRGDDTRLDLGKREVEKIISSSANGSSYTLVYVTESPEIVYEEITDRKQALKLLDGLTLRYGTSSTVDALGEAQKYFDNNNSVKTYLITDKTYEESSNVEIIGVGYGEENYSVSDLKCEVSGGKLTVDGVLYSYASDASLTVCLYVDGEKTPSVEQKIDVKKAEETKFTIQADRVEYASARVVIKEKDALPLDNESTVYNIQTETSHKTLIVSESGKPIFIQAVMGVTNVDSITVKDYEENIKYRSGYALYVYDSYTPAALPSDGAVWFFNPTENVDKSGFVVGKPVPLTSPGVKMEASKNPNSEVGKMLEGLLDKDENGKVIQRLYDTVYVKTYVPCTIRSEYLAPITFGNNTPLVFANTNGFGNRQVVFTFSLHETDQALSPIFSILCSNLLNYTFPQVLEKSNYFCGERVEISVPANCDSIKVVAPDGSVDYLATDSYVVEFTVDTVGDYTITLLSGNSERVVNVRSDLPMEERLPHVTEEAFNILGEAGNETRDGVYDDLLYLFIILAVIFAADWMVYCYEQYQLK